MENVKMPENKNLTPDGSFKTKDGRTTYLVSVFFYYDSTEIAESKVKRLIITDLKKKCG